MATVYFGICTPPAPAQCREQQKLTDSDGGAADWFGVSVSMSGDVAAVAASHEITEHNSGSVSVFRFNGSRWVVEQKLTAPGASALGVSVSISGDAAIAGSPNNRCASESACGAAYVFRFNGTSWIQEQKLTASDAGAFDWFGISASISRDTVVVGAQRDDCAAGLDCGSAYVFRFNGTSWVEEQKLTAPDPEEFDRFGVSVSVSGDTVLVGADHADCAAGRLCGSAYAFRFNGSSWLREQTLTASDAAPFDWFGGAVSVNGDTALVGAKFDNCEAALNCGSAYAFRFDGTSWLEEHKLNASDATAWGVFGNTVSVSGEKAVITAHRDDCAVGDCSGSAYVFGFNGVTWVEEQKLVASDAGVGDGFGLSASISGETAVVGAVGDDCTDGIACGSAYVFACGATQEVADLDIKPGSCPNMVNPRSNGVVPVAIVGGLDFDVAAVDPDSLTLARTDGVGESVSPLSGRGGRGIVIKDVAAPFDGEPCECHDADRDGIDDLAMKFSTADLRRAFQLNGLPRGTSIELVLRGTLQDGTEFEGVDCIVIPGSEPNSGRRRRPRPPK